MDDDKDENKIRLLSTKDMPDEAAEAVNSRVLELTGDLADLKKTNEDVGYFLSVLCGAFGALLNRAVRRDFDKAQKDRLVDAMLATVKKNFEEIEFGEFEEG